jgi:hypothetical protein
MNCIGEAIAMEFHFAGCVPCSALLSSGDGLAEWNSAKIRPQIQFGAEEKTDYHPMAVPE